MTEGEAKYDVFLSYNSRDREEVAKVAAFLREERQLQVFFDVSSLVPGDPWQTVLEQAIPSSRSVIVFLGKDGLGPWQDDETKLALIHEKRGKGCKVIPVLLPGADQPSGFLELKQWIRAGSNSDPATLDAISRALGINGAQVVPSPETEVSEVSEVSDISPYRGLFPFRAEDASFYFGRESFIQTLRQAVESNSLTALVGSSGSGKSSVVHAGLIPDLRKSNSGIWQAISMRPGAHPISSLASSLARLLEPEKSLQATADRLAESLLCRKETLVSLAARAGGTGTLLLVVDQWEELYTLAEDGGTERNRFIEEILAATRSNMISVLILFRGDFYGRVMEHPELRLRLKGDCLIPLPDMSRDDLRRAMEEPARKAGLSFDSGLVDEILLDLEWQPGRLPLLEFVLARLWNERDTKRRKLLQSSYILMGGLRGALSRQADEITRAMPEAEVRRLFLRLVRIEKDEPVTRRRARLEELDQHANEIALRFIESRLLVTGWDSKTGEEILEIAHEAIIHHWQRLRAWIEENRPFLIWREPLEHDVAEWMEKGQKDIFLLTAGPLQVAEFWFGKNADDLSPEAHGYIRLSIEKRARERRWRMFLRSAAAALVMAFLGLFGSVLSLRASQAYARSAALAAEAARLADRKFDLALLLALQAGKIKETADAIGVTLSLTAGNPALRHFLRLPPPGPKEDPQRQEEVKPGEILAVAFGTGDLIASGGKGRIFLWDAKQGTLHGRPLETGEPSQVLSLAFSPDGSLLASGSEAGGLIRLWKIWEGTELDPIPVDSLAQDGSARNISVQNLTFDPTGGLLAWSTPFGIYVWDIRQGVEIRRIRREAPPTASNWVSGLAFEPSGKLVWSTADGRLWGLGKGQPLQPLAEPGGTVLGVAVSPNGSLVSAGSSFLRWDLRNGEAIGDPCSLLSRAEDEVISVAFSRNRRFVASGHLDHKIRLWDVSKEGCPLFATLTGHSGLIWSLAFGGENLGKRLALISAGEEGDLILWEAHPEAPTFSLPLWRRSPKGLTTLAVSPGGSLVAVGDSVGQITLYDGNTRERIDSNTTRNQRSVYRMAFSGDGRVLATGGPEGHVLLWDVGQRNLRMSGLLSAEGGQDPIRSLAISQDSAWVAAGTRAGRLLVWRPAVSNTPALPIQKLSDGPVMAMTFATETSVFSRMLPFFRGKQKEYLVTGGSDGRLTLWDLEGKKEIDTEVAHSQVITSLVARADGLLASGSLDRNVRLWRLDHGLRHEETLFLGWRITDLDLSPQGDLLAAVGEEPSSNEIVLWDLRARKPLGAGFQAPGMIRRVAFGPSGQSLFLGGKEISSWWDLRPETWTTRACEMVRRGLSRDEIEKYLKPSEQPVVCNAVM